ncbi:hypothetical protein ON010_g11930 [Phytophthora cinnamomi]|nr:hypothetical protein ON010_g11930 [Phytophthora cinnamomi]
MAKLHQGRQQQQAGDRHRAGAGHGWRAVRLHDVHGLLLGEHRARLLPAARGRARGVPRAGSVPPRHQAGEPAAGRELRAEDRGLRLVWTERGGRRRRCRAVHAVRHQRIHESGGAVVPAVRRRAGRRLVGWSGAVYHARGLPALPDRHQPGLPQERITLAEIKTHPWFKEDAVAPEDLRAELLSRKVQVEEEKRKEREEKLRAAAKQRLQQQEEEFDPFNMDVERSMALPTAAGPMTAEVSSKKAPSYPAASVALYTSFQSNRTATELQTRVEKALTEHSARFVAHKDRFKTKATMTADAEDVGVAVRIYSLDNAPGRCVVEFRRTSGACLKFHDAYKKLSASLSDLVWDNNDESEAADDSPAEELISDEAMMI